MKPQGLEVALMAMQTKGFLIAIGLNEEKFVRDGEHSVWLQIAGPLAAIVRKWRRGGPGLCRAESGVELTLSVMTLLQCWSVMTPSARTDTGIGGGPTGRARSNIEEMFGTTTLT